MWCVCLWGWVGGLDEWRVWVRVGGGKVRVRNNFFKPWSFWGYIRAVSMFSAYRGFYERSGSGLKKLFQRFGFRAETEPDGKYEALRLD